MATQPTKRYVIAVKRQHRHSVPTDWHHQLKQIPGVTIVGASHIVAQVDATDEGLSRLRSVLGEGYNIEEASERTPLGS